jgi:hypothetical protein
MEGHDVEVPKSELRHIRAVEEFRHAVQQELATSTRHRLTLRDLFEKVVFPSTVAVLTYLLLPQILKISDDARRTAALRAELMGEVASEPSAVVTARIEYEEAADEYLSEMLMVSTRRAAMEEGRRLEWLPAPEWKETRDSLREDAAKATDSQKLAVTRYNAAYHHYVVWREGLQARVKAVTRPAGASTGLAILSGALQSLEGALERQEETLGEVFQRYKGAREQAEAQATRVARDFATRRSHAYVLELEKQAKDLGLTAKEGLTGAGDPLKALCEAHQAAVTKALEAITQLELRAP